ncbi:UDP-glucose 4-epimerase GalE [Asticcacaulis sp. ZE23SCel15]|uniref:UDP-glucose 4-epimerase GalE n=1 Tax=Asticcacaulis sp. ZE23SCel15 TaxID=3059027 RepID=UPI00265E2BA7|nr:UDP-glucose 4-epimerase GalE [Asticcacaulis sp. ZE23SCel15]WKL58578.1 UDP-glucose 4-epimerase GalE [Asticcacaulis sp. ZE23SCel15]
MSKAVLVAGGAGYIGAQTCKVLHQSGYIPVTLDSLVTGHEGAVKWGPLIRADLRDREAILKAIETYGITSAIHFAAFSLVGESTRDPAKYYDNNVAAATAFTSALIEGGVKAMVFSSTAATYGTPQSDLIPETHPTLPINPYGASKLAFEQALYWMGQAHGLKHTILRYFNAAGADPDGEIGESHLCETHLIPLMCQAALGKGKPLTVFGTDYDTRDGTPVRDYIHVVDLATAHVAAIERLLNGGDSQIFNVGTGEGLTVLEVIKMAEKVLGIPVPHSFGPRREGDPQALVADVAKIKSMLDWQPKYSDLETLIRTAAHWQKTRPY